MTDRDISDPSAPDAGVASRARDAIGAEMIDWMRALWSLPRSLSGPGVRRTLDFLGAQLPDLRRHAIASGTPVFDWVAPKEWRFKSARLTHESGAWSLDAADSLLHVVGYSAGVDTRLSLDALRPRLHTLPEHPDWTPYVTSYYRETWGFCLSQAAYDAMPDGVYHVQIEAELLDGQLDYADLVLPGASSDEILFSTYICHPDLANNELSGPVLALALAREIAAWPERRMTYRFVFAPETIGAIIYLSENLAHLKDHVRAGFVLSCVGDERAWSHVGSRLGDSLADRALEAALIGREPVRRYSFLARGSDERQYCAPGVDLPVCGFCRSKYGEYPEYHSSADNFDVVTAEGLAGSFETMRQLARAFELNDRYVVQTLGEPQLGKRGLYPDLSVKRARHPAQTRMDVLAYCDGAHDVFDIARRIGSPLSDVCAEIDILAAHGLVRPAGADAPSPPTS